MQCKINMVCEIGYMGHSAYLDYCDAYGLNSTIEKNLRILQKNIA
jgi:hypothetical protein